MDFKKPYNELLEEVAVINFREYIKYKSIAPDINYGVIITFLKRLALDLNLIINEFEFQPNKPTLILTWLGNKPKLKSILLMSHMDVGPVDADKWSQDPFSSYVDNFGNIFGRGTQGSKCIGIQYLEAIKILKRQNVEFARTVHIMFLPHADTETENRGTCEFAESIYFGKYDIGFVLDEGMATSKDTYLVFIGERTFWHVCISCHGPCEADGASYQNKAERSFTEILDRLYQLRRSELNKIVLNESLALGDILSLNITMIEGGVGRNIVSSELSMMLDCKIPITWKLYEFEDTLEYMCHQTDANYKITYINKQENHTPVLPQHNPFLKDFNKTTDILKLKTEFGIMPTVTDGRIFRLKNIAVVGFTPIINTENRTCGHNEYINVITFIKGINIYVDILRSVGNDHELF